MLVFVYVSKRGFIEVTVITNPDSIVVVSFFTVWFAFFSRCSDVFTVGLYIRICQSKKIYLTNKALKKAISPKNSKHEGYKE